MDPHEWAANFASDGSVACVLDWLETLGRGDVPAMWRSTAPVLRLALAQNLILAQPWSKVSDREELDRHAEALAEAAPDLEEWPNFQRGILRILSDKYQHLDLATWGPMRPRPAGVDREKVLLVPNPSGDRVIAPGEKFLATPFLVVRSNAYGWQVAGFGSTEPTPGWPPAFNEESRTDY